MHHVKKSPGGMFENHPSEGEETPSFKGSAMIVVADTVDEVKAVLTGDIYATSGVWDVENANIVPVCLLAFSFHSFHSLFLFVGLVGPVGRLIMGSLNRLFGWECREREGLFIY